MTRDRSAVTLIAFAALLASPPSGASAAAPASSRLSATPPAWLATPAPPQAAPQPASTASTPLQTSPTPVPTAGSALPRTGEDLLPLVVTGTALLAAGVVIRTRRA
jgi:hypothetical protein